MNKGMIWSNTCFIKKLLWPFQDDQIKEARTGPRNHNKKCIKVVQVKDVYDWNWNEGKKSQTRDVFCRASNLFC